MRLMAKEGAFVLIPFRCHHSAECVKFEVGLSAMTVPMRDCEQTNKFLLNGMIHVSTHGPNNIHVHDVKRYTFTGPNTPGTW